MTSHHIVMEVTIHDDYTGEPLTVPVELDYVIDRDASYGADADGRRGVRREEVHLLDSAIPPDCLRRLSVSQITALSDAIIRNLTRGRL